MKTDFPIRASANGMEFVILPVAEYEAMRRASDGVSLPGDIGWYDQTDDKIFRALLNDGGRSPILRNHELARFLIVCLRAKPQTEIIDECLERFGPANTPSTSALNRFAVRVRALRRTLSQ